VSAPGVILSADDRTSLLGILARSQQFGFLGPGPLEPQIDRSLAFTLAVASPTHLLDLGSGGGLPGFVLAFAWPHASLVLLDGSVRRCAFLSAVVKELGWQERITVLAERAEVTGRSRLRGRLDLVVARGFGPAAVTAECAAPLLCVGGNLVVSEPPGGAPERWPATELAALGLEPRIQIADPIALQVLHQVAPCPDRFPRRVGIPAKRPIFT
jgi:16S rRNA (guanine527-N7)-methyltransferase